MGSKDTGVPTEFPKTELPVSEESPVAMRMPLSSSRRPSHATDVTFSHFQHMELASAPSCGSLALLLTEFGKICEQYLCLMTSVRRVG